MLIYFLYFNFVHAATPPCSYSALPLFKHALHVTAFHVQTFFLFFFLDWTYREPLAA